VLVTFLGMALRFLRKDSAAGDKEGKFVEKALS
jgi:hypothetical protein